MRTTTSEAGSPLAPAWLSVPEDQSRLVGKLWAEDVERGDDGVLEIDGVGVTELAQQYGTPLFVVSEADFRARARTFRDAFDEAFRDLCDGVDVFYAGKSFLCSEVAHWVREEGLGLDTCSGGELAVALSAGLPGRRLGLHGNNKSVAEITRAVDADLARIVVDSLQEVAVVGDLAVQRGTTANVMLRLTPGVHAHTHEFIATAHEDQKFGLSMVREPAGDRTGDHAGGRGADDAGDSPAERAVAAALAHPGIHLLGVHCHIGSQIFEAEGFELAARRLLRFLAGIRHRHGVDLPELDLGGGYGIAYTEADEPHPAAEIARAMAAVVGATCRELGLRVPRISIEPGRAIAGPSTFTLYTVGTTKTVQVVPAGGGTQQDPAPTQPRRYVSVDGGMSDNARPVLYGADYSVVLASRSSEATPVLSRVVGKHCESGDVVVRDAYLPADTGSGDLLAVPGTGAYCWVLASNYNYVTRPPVVAVADGVARLIVRGETEDDLLRRDVRRGTATDEGDPRP